MAVNVPLSLDPALLGAYCTVTLHDFFGPRLTAVQVSAVFENTADPLSNTFSAAVATPPEFVSVNAFRRVVPESIVPKSFEAGLNASDGEPPANAAGTRHSNATSPTAIKAGNTRLRLSTFTMISS